MKPLFCVTLLLFIFDMIGIGTLELLKKIIKSDCEPKCNLSIVIGAGVMVCVSQLLSLFLDGGSIAIIWWCILILIGFFYGKRHLKNLIEKFRENISILVAAVGSFFMFAYPMIGANDLMSYQYINNDIIYYLSTIDWLQEHSLLQKVVYTPTRPLYRCAEYIFSSTRYGTDTLASTLGRMLHLEAHEIFSLLGIAFIIVCGIVVFYLSRNVLKMSNQCSLAMYFLTILFCNWKELLVLQYVPQMLGICFFIGFITFMIEYFIKDDKYAMVLSSLFLAATACTYAEYSSYMLIIYLGLLIIQCIYTKKVWENLKGALLIGIGGLICNPLGFFIAVKFNLKILTAVKDSTENIDAYGGHMKSITSVVAQLLGIPGENRLNNVILQQIYSAILIIGIIILLMLLVYVALKKKSKILYFCMWILTFFVGYECYFRYVQLAYGEFKHLIGIGLTFTIILFYGIYSLEGKRKVVFNILVTSIICLNLINFVKTYPFKEVVCYDKVLMEARDKLDTIPANETIGILGNAHYIQHELVYAAKGHDVNLMGNGINSYFTMLGIPLNNEISDYILCERNTKELLAPPNGYFIKIWENSRFMLIKSEVR